MRRLHQMQDLLRQALLEPPTLVASINVISPHRVPLSELERFRLVPPQHLDIVLPDALHEDKSVLESFHRPLLARIQGPLAGILHLCISEGKAHLSTNLHVAVG